MLYVLRLLILFPRLFPGLFPRLFPGLFPGLLLALESEACSQVPQDSRSVDVAQRRSPTALLPFLLPFFLGGLLSGLFAPAAEAAVVSISLLQVVDGTPNFDTSDGPGLDSSSSNSIVRVNDTIQYTWNYSINNPFPAENVTITLDTLPEGVAWTRLPLECVGPGSAISNNGRNLICNLGDFTQNISRNFIATAKIGGQLANGDVVRTGATIGADSSTSSSSVPVITAVSALPQYDLRKNYVPRLFPQELDIGNGPEQGLAVYYGLGLVVDISNQAKGVEQLASPIPLTDSLANLSPNATLIGCGPNALNGAPPIWQLPAGAGGDFRSVNDSGSFACTQPGGPGGDIDITLSGTDTSSFDFPTSGYGNAPLPANDGYVATGYVAVWVPARDIGNSGIQTVNQFTNFAPLSISNQRNFSLPAEPDTTNNDYPFFIPPAGGNFEKAYRDVTEDKLPTQAGWRSGDGLVTPGQRFSHRLNLGNLGALPLNNVIACDRIDHPNIEVTSSGLIYARSETDNYISILGNEGTDYFVEYAAGDNSTPSRRLATCGDFNDATTDGPWFSDPQTVPGGPSAISKFRVRVPTLPAFAQWYFGVEAQVAGNAPSNTLLTNYASFRADNFGDGSWQHATEDVTDFFSPMPQWVDRLKITGAIVRINKTIAQTDVLAGDTVNFELNPTVTAESSAITTRVIVTDTLPPELTYVDQSANIAPTSISQAADGRQVLIWVFDPVNTNDTLPMISFDATAALDTPNGTIVTNEVQIESPDDATSDDPSLQPSQRPRYDEASVTIQNPAAFNINKRTTTPVIEKDQPLSFFLEYANLSAVDTYNFVDIIDVFPYVGDSIRPGTESTRNPPSQYSGSLELATPPSGIPGITVYYTKQDPSLIHSDPTDPSNQPSPGGSTTQWCDPIDFGIQPVCPTSLTDSTAARIITPPLLPNSSVQTLTLTFNSSGNKAGDRYTNKFGAEASGLPNPVFSNPAVVEVVGSDPSILLVKRITAINGSTDRTAQAGQDLSQYYNEASNPYDDNQLEPALAPNPPQYPTFDTEYWPTPNNFLIGGYDVGPVAPGDEVEYTIYFLSNGDKVTDNVTICDAIPADMTFVSAAFSPAAAGGDSGILLNFNGQTTALSNGGDGDRGEFIPPGTSIASQYPNLPNCTNQGSGAVVVNLGSVPAATSIGNPLNSFGFIRLRTLVK